MAMGNKGFGDGYVQNRVDEDERLMEENPGYDPNYKNIQNLMEQVSALKAQPVAQAPRGDSFSPLMASAFSNLASSAGSLGGKKADSGFMPGFIEQLGKEREAFEKRSTATAQGARAAKLGELENKLALAKMLRGEGKEAQAAQLQRDRLNEEKRRSDILAAQNATKATQEEKREKREIEKDEFDRKYRTAQLELDKQKSEQPKAPRAVTADEKKAAGFGKRIEGSIKIFDALLSQGFDRTSYKSGLVSMLPTSAQNKYSQQQEQAERNFINAVLRRESGAAISPTEFTSAELQYFPRAGDSREVLANKQANRQQILESFKAESGPFWEKVPLITPDYRELEEAPGEFDAMAAPSGGVSEYKIGDIKEARGKKWEYLGGDKWKVIPALDKRGNMWRR